MADIITGGRILCSIALLFFPAFSPAFYILYAVAGVSDMVDGTVARKTNTVSELGSKLDTAADFILIAACLIKLIPAFDIPLWLIIWIAGIALIKIINFISGFVTRKEFVAAHTVMNKVAGILLFILPLTLKVVDIRYSGAFVCAAATAAAIQEGHYIRTKGEHTFIRMKTFLIETERLHIQTTSEKEMREIIHAEKDEDLRTAYCEMLQGALEHPDQWEWFAIWTITLKTGDRIGDLCFKGRRDDGSVEIGYGILEPYQGRGYATEAVGAAVCWALRRPDVVRVEAETEPGNRASQRVLEKCGFLPTGTTGEEGPRFAKTPDPS